ncbi:MAG: GIY-YIG nuclease family protein [Candidatus Paceibacterota bacterium]
MYYVYLIQSKKKPDWNYIGYSENLKKRIESHNKFKNLATKPYAPFTLLYYEAFRKNNDALRREKYLKTSKGKRTLRLMLSEEI